MAKDSDFIRLPDVVEEMGYIPDCVDLKKLGILLLQDKLKAGIFISEDETILIFYNNRSLRKAINKHIASCI